MLRHVARAVPIWLLRTLPVLHVISWQSCDAAWSYMPGAHAWLQLTACQSSTLGPCVLPPALDASANVTVTHPTINLVKNEQFALSWSISERNRPAISGATERAFVQMEKTPCTTGLPGGVCSSSDTGDVSGCSKSLAGRHNIFAEQCSPLTTHGACTGQSGPCVWNSKKSQCGE